MRYLWQSGTAFSISFVVSLAQLKQKPKPKPSQNFIPRFASTGLNLFYPCTVSTDVDILLLVVVFHHHHHYIGITATRGKLWQASIEITRKIPCLNQKNSFTLSITLNYFFLRISGFLYQRIQVLRFYRGKILSHDSFFCFLFLEPRPITN